MTKGTPVRRNSEDFELPATLIGATPYLLAAKFLEADIMRVLAAGGADPRLPMKTGETPLMAAAGMGAGPQTDRRGLSVLDGGKIEPERRVATAVSAAHRAWRRRQRGEPGRRHRAARGRAARLQHASSRSS